MPNVGGVDYPYTPQGMAEARRAAANLGQTVPGYQGGGLTDTYLAPLALPGLPLRRSLLGGDANAPEHQMTSQAVNMLDPHTGIDSSLGRTLAGLTGYPLGKLALAFGLYGDIPKNPMAPSNIGPWGVNAPPGRLVGPAAESKKEAEEKMRQENAAWRSRQRIAAKAVTDARKGVHVARVTPATGFFGMSADARAAEGDRAAEGARAAARNAARNESMGSGVGGIADGGYVGGGLGFRPLGFQNGGDVEVEDPSTQHARDLKFLKRMFSGDMENLPPEYRWDLDTLETAFYEWGKNADVARRAAENLRKALEGPQEEFQPDVDPDSEFGKFRWPMGLTVTGPAGQPSGVRPGDTGPSVPGPSDKSMYGMAPRERMTPMERMTTPMEGLTPMDRRTPSELPAGARDWQKDIEDRRNYDRLKELYPPSEWDKKRGFGKPGDSTWSWKKDFSEGIADGGYVGRRPGHYAHGGVAGDLSKRHRDPDWYRRMSGGLGSLGPRRRAA